MISKQFNHTLILLYILVIGAVGRGAIVAWGIKYHILHNKHTFCTNDVTISKMREIGIPDQLASFRLIVNFTGTSSQ